MLRATAAAMAVLLAVPSPAAYAAGKAPLTIRAKATGPANRALTVFWRASRAATNNYMRIDKASTVAIPGTIYVGTRLQGGSGEALHRWRFAGDFPQSAMNNGQGLRLAVPTDPNDCLAASTISAMARLQSANAETLLSRVILIGHVREVCDVQGKAANVAAADKAIHDLYSLLRSTVRGFDGGMCSSETPCRT